MTNEWIVGFEISLGVPVRFVVLVALMSAWVTHTYSIVSKNVESLAHFSLQAWIQNDLAYIPALTKQPDEG
jgi:hypothetical protein